MNTAANNSRPSKRAIDHKRLRYASWVTVIMALVGYPPALILFALATTSCWGSSHEFWWCEIFSTLPWVGLALSLAAYLIILWLINDLGREAEAGTAPRRYAWRQAKLGYKSLDKGHHRMVRRVHRVSSVALAAVAAYISFQLFEADTLVNIAVGAIAYALGELLNWKKFTQLK